MSATPSQHISVHSLPGRSSASPVTAAGRKPRGRARTTLKRVSFYFLFPLATFLCFYHLFYSSRLKVHTLHVWRRFIHWYFRQLHLNPLLTRTFSAGFIFLFADLLAQKFSSPVGTAISLGRLFRYSTYGGFIIAPFLYYWYGAMNYYAPRDDIFAALAKCIFEQLTLEPSCIILYIIYDGLLCKRDWNSIMRRTRTCFFPLWVKNAIFWMPANFTNYYIATPDLRVVFSNLCSLFWNAYFSSKINNSAKIKNSSIINTTPKYNQVSTGDSQV